MLLELAMTPLLRSPAPLAGLFLALAAPILLLGQVGPDEDEPAPVPEDILIDDFTAEVEDPGARRVRFSWRIADEHLDEELSCTLDVGSPDVLAESVEDCDETTSADHSYEEPGTYRASLVARSRSGGSDRATATVTVD